MRTSRAMRFSVRHLSGLIYDAVDDFVRGPIRDQRAQPLLPKPDALQSRSAVARSFWVDFLARVRKRSLTLDDLCRRRNLANAASTNSSVAVGTSSCPIDGGSVGPVALHLQGAVQALKSERLLEPSNRCTADRRCGTSLAHADPHASTGFSSKIT